MQKKAQSQSASSSQDAIDLLTADHKTVQKLFKDFEKLKEKGKSSDKTAIVKQVCREITIHAQLEEEIFYPAVRAAIDDNGLVDEAEVEHEGVKELIAQLESMKPSDDLYDAKVTVLGENVEHHVKEEQEEMFPKAKKAKVDLRLLGEEMLERKKEIQEELETLARKDGRKVIKTEASLKKASAS